MPNLLQAGRMLCPRVLSAAWRIWENQQDRHPQAILSSLSPKIQNPAEESSAQGFSFQNVGFCPERAGWVPGRSI